MCISRAVTRPGGRLRAVKTAASPRAFITANCRPCCSNLPASGRGHPPQLAHHLLQGEALPQQRQPLRVAHVDDRRVANTGVGLSPEHAVAHQGARLPRRPSPVCGS